MNDAKHIAFDSFDARSQLPYCSTVSNHNQFRTLNGITAVIWTFLKLQTSILT